MRSTLLALAAAGVVAVLIGVPAAASDSSPTLTSAQIAQFAALEPSLQAVDAAAPAPDPPPGHLTVQPHEYDPGHTTLVQAEWSGATGCPNGASVATYPATKPTGTYTDPACTTADTSDHENDGLVLVKTGPTSNNAAAFAEVKGVKGPLTELGYDIRKLGGSASPFGSHCGAGAPRFDVQTTTDFYFVGCQSPPPDAQTTGDGWTRLRWGVAGTVMGFSASTFTLMPITGNVVSIEVVFDEGTDPSGGPDSSGAAVLDNIDVNGILGGTGPDDPEP